MEHAKIVIDLIRELGGKREATIYGNGFKTTSMHAALANSTAAHSLDLDDTHRESFFHVGACTIPPVLAVAEKMRSSGKEIITAIVAG